MRGVIANGGIGDLVISLPLLEVLPKELGRYKLYTHHPDVYKFYTGKKALSLADNPWTELLAKKWEYLLHIDFFSYFIYAKATGPHRNLLEKSSAFIKEHEIEAYVRAHPHYDGEVTDILQPKGFKRWTLPRVMLGMGDLPCVRREVKPLKFWDRDYITISVGVGNHHGAGRATKAWDYEFAKDLVSMVHEKYPKIKVVQLGSLHTSPKISGVDSCFLGLDIEQSFRILAGSRLHIDGDSGLSHVATSFGVKCIVLFGPTPANFFGYPQNVNLDAGLECSPCWWSTDTWNEKCPRGYQVPTCMNMIFPSRVFGEIEKIL